MSGASFARRVQRFVTEPGRVGQFVRQRVARYRLTRGHRRLQAVHDRLPPMPVPSSGPVELHTLCGHGYVVELVAMVRSLFRWIPERMPLVVHEFGGLDDADVAELRRHFPGVRIIPGATADTEVGGELARRGLVRCAELRVTEPMSRKLFDLDFYGAGKRVLYVDVDYAFHQRPDELLSLLAVPDERWLDAYNEDITSSYVWPEAELVSAFGYELLPRVNAGMLALRPDLARWSLYEQILSLPLVPGRGRYVEQTLRSIDLKLRGARVLSPEYDVSCRHAWGLEWGDPQRDVLVRQRDAGRPVVSQHYCGTGEFRYLYHERCLADYAADERR